MERFFIVEYLYSLLSTLLLMVPCTNLKAVDHPKKSFYRNIVIINGEENIARKSNFILAGKLISALEHKAAPILVSTDVWQHFVERKHEYAFRMLQADSKEACLMNHHKNVLERLFYWTPIFKKTSSSTAEMKQLITQQIGDEIEHDPGLALFKDHDPLLDQSQYELFFSFFVYLFNYEVDQWDCYRVNDYYYLLIPHDYLKKVMPERPVSLYKDYTAKEIALGLSVDHLEFIEDPLEASLLAFKPNKRNEHDFIRCLHEIFIPQAIYDATKISCAWNIFFIGHGGNMPISFSSQTWDIIAELSVDEFRTFLLFMNEVIKTSLFVYTTCYGAGKHLQEPYTVDGKPLLFQYPIVINNVTDVPSYGRWRFVIPPAVLKKKFLIEGYNFDETSGQWSLNLDDPNHNINNWKKIWKAVNTFNKSSDVEALVTDQFLEGLGGLHPENIPNVRFAGSDTFVICSPHVSIKINATMVSLKKYYKTPIIVDNLYVLLETNVITAPLLLKSKDPFPHIISVIPGHAMHYIKKVKASEYQPLDLLHCFWPLRASSFNKIFLIKKLICANNPQMTALLGLHENDKEVVLHNVMLYVDQDSLVRIFFQTDAGKSFSSFGRFMVTQQQLDFGLIVPMAEKPAAKYSAYFKKMKQELMTAYKNDTTIKSFKEQLEQLKVDEKPTTTACA